MTIILDRKSFAGPSIPPLVVATLSLEMTLTNLPAEITSPIQWPSWPHYGQDHEQAVLRVIRSNQLFAAGEVAAFEKEFANYVGSQFALGIGNATQGLQLALAALGIGTGDEVIVTPYSWISSASCVLMQNAIPVFVDIEPDSFGLCPHSLEKAITSRTKAVILVHMFGLSSKIKEIANICKAHKLNLVEDASHAHGAKYEGKHLGSFADIGVFSLHQRKAISTGDGGVICTGNHQLYEKIRRMRSFGSNQLSYNYRMTEFAAALGRVGLRNLERENALRKSNHELLASRLISSAIRVVEPSPQTSAVYYSNLLDINLPTSRQEALCKAANQNGIPLKRTWQPLHKHPHFKRVNMINNIAPWDWVKQEYIEPSSLHLEISEKYQEKRLFELDCHPLVPPESVSAAADWLKSAAE